MTTTFALDDRVQFWADEPDLPAGTPGTVTAVHHDDEGWVEVLLDDGRRFSAFDEVLEPLTD
ncbi:hypothetical protein OG875_04610 [Streptomyces sp. NBC_01498]|uniref:hypothetical protein n=1 Tax=Streptomyces sp. NBC_01498 TaxID=2975870 RepID=UPI002E7C3F83|nr:hypothetical protein [Streptomyces sp. NBC_01498]WTL23937.1 hypothetical protein OG875_04610 [Streptomyces sp. NBC_01498]